MGISGVPVKHFEESDPVQSKVIASIRRAGGVGFACRRLLTNSEVVNLKQPQCERPISTLSHHAVDCGR